SDGATIRRTDSIRRRAMGREPRMPLTPDQIADREFTFGLRGYDQDEVRAFLQLVAAEFGRAGAGAVAEPDTSDSTATGGGAPAGDDDDDAAATATATLILQRAHDEAVELRQSATAEAEMTRA